MAFRWWAAPSTGASLGTIWMIRFGAGRRGSRLPLGSRSSRKSPLDYGVRPTRHREASSGCFAAAEATSSHLSVKGARSSGDFWLLRRRRATRCPCSRRSGWWAQVRAGGSRAVRVVSRPQSAFVTGSAAVASFPGPSRVLPAPGAADHAKFRHSTASATHRGPTGDISAPTRV